MVAFCAELGVVLVFYINKIVVTRQGRDFVMPFYSHSLAFVETRDKFHLTLVDSKTLKKTIIDAEDFVTLLNKIYDFQPYGYAVTQEGFGEYDRFVSVSKQAMKFLEYIDSVELVCKSDCHIDFSAFTEFQACDILDENASLFVGNMVDRDGDFTAYAEVEITLYDAVCLSQMYHDDKCFYIKTDIQCTANDGVPDLYVYKVNCSDFRKVQSMIAQSKVYRPNLFHDLFMYGRQ